MNRLMKHAVAALVLASPATLSAQQPAPAQQFKRPPAAQGSKKLALPSINRRSFDWLLGEAQPASDEPPADGAAPPEGTNSQRPARESPRLQGERNFKVGSPPNQAAASAEATLSKTTAEAPATPPAQDKAQAPAAPRPAAVAPPKPSSPIVVRTQPPVAKPAVEAAASTKPPAGNEAAAPSTPAQAPETTAPLPRIVLSQPSSVIKPVPRRPVVEIQSEAAAPLAAGVEELSPVTVHPIRSRAPEIVAPRANTRSLVSSAVRYGPVLRGTPSISRTAAPAPAAAEPDRIVVVESTPQMRLTPIAETDDSTSGLAATPVEAEDLAAALPLRPQPASPLAMFAQGSSTPTGVSAMASPSMILRTLHTYGTIGGSDPVGDIAAGQQHLQQPGTAQPIPTTSPLPRPQQPTLAAARAVQPAGHTDPQPTLAPANSTNGALSPTPVTAPASVTNEPETPVAEPAKLPAEMPPTAIAPQPQQQAPPVTAFTKPTFPTVAPSAANGHTGNPSGNAGKSIKNATSLSIKDRIASLVTVKPAQQPHQQPTPQPVAQPAPQPAAQPPVPSSVAAAQPASQMPQQRSTRTKVIHGTVVRVNAQSGQVVLGFNERADLAPGTRVQVYRREVFNRHQLGEVEVISGQGDQFVARPIGKLKAVQIAMEDELVLMP